MARPACYRAAGAVKVRCGMTKLLEKRKNVLYTLFALVMVKLIAPERITTEMIRSKEWAERRKKFYELFEDVVIEQENRKETK